jgi:tRNA-dihydrouridine synthase
MFLGFWKDLKKKKKIFFTLAPMANVTDVSFRQTVLKYSNKEESYGGPDVFWTEFVSADGLILGGEEHILKDLFFEENERPIVAQVFGSNPETMRKAVCIISKLGFDGIDINMGCPDKSIERQGAGSMMIKNPMKAEEIIRAAKMGIYDSKRLIPLSVKTRIGYSSPEIDKWITFLLKQELAVLTVHTRTRKELSKTKARWEFLKDIVKLRDEISPETLIVGNGDIESIDDGLSRALENGVDGVMIGRASIGNPWIFDKNSKKEKNAFTLPDFLNRILPSILIKKIKGNRKYTILNKTKEERIEAMMHHAFLFDKYLSFKNFSVFKRHIKAYLNGFPDAKHMRQEIFDNVDSYKDLKSYFKLD